MSGLDVKEIKELMRGLDKADPDGVLDILEKLKRGIHPTEKLLRETKLGIAVNKHRNDSDARISSMVKTIIRLWKEKITAEKNRVNGSATSNKQQSGSSKSPTPSASASSSARPAAAGASGGGGGDTSSSGHVGTVSSNGGPRSAKADGISIQIYNDKVRNSCVEVMYNALCVDSSESPQTVLNCAKAIEKTAHGNEGGTTPAYRTKMRSLMMNLKDKSNPHLRKNVVSGNISAERLCKMSPQEMASDDLKKEIEQLSKKNLFNAQGAKEIRAVTDRFTCGKCKHKKVSYYQMQTRSADEPLTTFCTCENCGNRWKFS